MSKLKVAAFCRTQRTEVCSPGVTQSYYINQIAATLKRRELPSGCSWIGSWLHIYRVYIRLGESLGSSLGPLGDSPSPPSDSRIRGKCKECVCRAENPSRCRFRPSSCQTHSRIGFKLEGFRSPNSCVWRTTSQVPGSSEKKNEKKEEFVSNILQFVSSIFLSSGVFQVRVLIQNNLAAHQENTGHIPKYMVDTGSKWRLFISQVLISDTLCVLTHTHPEDHRYDYQLELCCSLLNADLWKIILCDDSFSPLACN